MDCCEYRIINGISCSELSLAFTGKRDNRLTGSIRDSFNNGRKKYDRSPLKIIGIAIKGGKKASQYYDVEKAKDVIKTEFYENQKFKKYLRKSITCWDDLEKLINEQAGEKKVRLDYN